MKAEFKSASRHVRHYPETRKRLMIDKTTLAIALVFVLGSLTEHPIANAQLRPIDGPFDKDPVPIWYETSYAEQINTGRYHTCMVNTCGDIECWGRNDYGQASPPAGDFSQVTAGAFHTCGLKSDGSVQCWGNNSWNQTAVPAQSRFRAIEAGAYHTCGVSTTGTTRCWGHNGNSRATPGGLIANETALDAAAGDAHSCAVLYHSWGNDIVCWGLDNYGQTSNVPSTQHPYVDEHLAVTTGNRHSCSRSRLGEIECWGNDSYGQSSGVGFEPSQPTTAWAVEEEPGLFLHSGYFDFFDVSAGDWHTCALGSSLGADNARCWGYNGSGQAAPPSGTFTDIEAGGYHSCGIRTNGSVSCWGSDTYGQSSPPALPGTCSNLTLLQTFGQ
jgi:alpha-tubulin suppressor-like RCC1 family protein